MALVVADRVQETTSTTGTSSYALLGATAGHQSFGAALANGDTTYYAITDNINWEVGIGTYSTTGPTLARTTILASSNGGSAVNWGVGVKNIFLTYAADRAVYLDAAGDLPLADKIVHSGDTNTSIRFPATDTVTVETAGAERMRITSTGNVGIGASSPNANLELGPVSATQGPTLRLSAGAGGDVGIPNYPYGTIEFYSGDPSGGGASVRATVAGIADTSSADPGGYLTFSTQPPSTGSLTERLRVDSSGNVGIGTATPVDTLTVNGGARFSRAGATLGSVRDITFELDNNNDFSLRGLVPGQTATRVKIQTIHEGPGAQKAIGFFTSNVGLVSAEATERMRIGSSGNVGIGTSAPIVPLHVVGDTITSGDAFVHQPAQSVESGAATLTIAELLTRIIQYTGALATLTMPTGTSIEGGVPATFPTNMSFDFSVINTGSGAATLGTAAGLTLVGSMAVAAGTSGLFRVRKTALNTYTIYRIG